MKKIMLMVLMVALTPLALRAEVEKTGLEKTWEQVKLHFLDNVSPITLYDVPSSGKMLGLATTFVRYKAGFLDVGYLQSLDDKLDSSPLIGLGLSTTKLFKTHGINLESITPKAKLFENMKLGVFISKPFKSERWMWGPYMKFQLDFE